MKKALALLFCIALGTCACGKSGYSPNHITKEKITIGVPFHGMKDTI